MQYKNVSPVYIHVEIEKGAVLSNVLREAASMALERMLSVDFTFNDRHYVVCPDRIINLIKVDAGPVCRGER